MTASFAPATNLWPAALAVRESCRLLLDRLNALGGGIKNIWVADSEFHSQVKSETGLYDAHGGLQVPVCFVFINPVTGDEIRQFYVSDEPYPPCPISLGPDTLLVAFASTAELLTMLQLWSTMPTRVLDLEMEWLALNNEEYTRDRLKNESRAAKKTGELSPLSLLGVCALHGISTRDQEHKDRMRDLVLRGGPWTPTEQHQILDYCAEDVYDTTALLAAMWPKFPAAYYCRQRIDPLFASAHRGRTMLGFAWMMHNGIPIDVEMNNRLSRHFVTIMMDLYREIRDEFPVFKDEDSFDIAPSKWREFLQGKGWLDSKTHPWPMTKGGKKKKKKEPRRDMKGKGGSDGTIPQMALIYPELKKLSTVLEIRSSTKLGLNFPVGLDNRHRVPFWPYGTVTSRCAPSSSEYMLAGGSPAFRHLAKPAVGEILIEADYSAQEVWIAAYLSGDVAMKRMLAEADPYIAFGELSGVIPKGSLKRFIAEHGTVEGVKLCKKKHEAERTKLKAITLGVLYGKTPWTVARECGISIDEAKALLKLHRHAFPKFWNWIRWVVNEALITRKISTRLGWTRWILPKRQRDEQRAESGVYKKIQNSLQNYLMQAHGAEILRLACVYAAEMGLKVCAPLHDALFAHAGIEDEELAVAMLRKCMERASIDVIGVAIPIEFSVVRYPNSFIPSKKPTAVIVWGKMMKSLEEAEKREGL